MWTKHDPPNEDEIEMPDRTPERQKLKIIMDANAFFVPLQFKISLPSELEHLLKKKFDMILLSPVKHELITLANSRSPSTQKNAKHALTLAEKCTYVEMKTSTSLTADDAIVEAAKDWNTAVFTNDRQLRKKLRDISVPVIYVRQKSRLEINGMT